MPRNGAYWVCQCGEWTWATKQTCKRKGCAGVPPEWVQQRPEAKSANGTHPTTEASLAEWITQPKGRRQQAKARGQATAAAAADSEQTAKPPAAMEIDEMVVDVEADAAEATAAADTLESRLQDAEQAVKELEAVGPAAKAGLHGFAEHLSTAVARAEDLRMQLQSERKAAKPLHWQLVEVQGKLKSKKAAHEKGKAAQTKLHKEKEDLEARTAENLVDVEDAAQAVQLAEAAVAAVQAEIAKAVPPTDRAGGQAPKQGTDLTSTAQGMAEQLAAFPNAVAAGDAEAAFGVLQEQMAALQRSFACTDPQQDAAPRTGPQVAPQTGPAEPPAVPRAYLRERQDRRARSESPSAFRRRSRSRSSASSDSDLSDFSDDSAKQEKRRRCIARKQLAQAARRPGQARIESFAARRVSASSAAPGGDVRGG